MHKNCNVWATATLIDITSKGWIPGKCFYAQVWVWMYRNKWAFPRCGTKPNGLYLYPALATCIPCKKRTCPNQDSKRVPSRVEPKPSIPNPNILVLYIFACEWGKIQVYFLFSEKQQAIWFTFAEAANLMVWNIGKQKNWLKMCCCPILQDELFILVLILSGQLNTLSYNIATNRNHGSDRTKLDNEDLGQNILLNWITNHT